MTITATPVVATSPPSPSVRPLVRTGAVAGVIAAALTLVVGLTAQAIDVPMQADGKDLVPASFPFVTLVFVGAGMGLAALLARWAHHPRRSFLLLTVGLTALSLIPPFTVDVAMATRVMLDTVHLVAAAVVIPALARCLPDER
jgi:hypothetical protein